MPAAKPPHVRLRAVELARTLGGRGAAAALAKEGVHVSKSVIDGWMREALASAQPSPSTASAGPPADAARPSGLCAIPLEPNPTADGGRDDLPEGLRGIDPAALDFAKLETLERDVVTFRETAHGDGAVRTYSALARLEIEILSWKAKLRPPPVVPPDEDPANLQAKAQLRDRLERLRADTEASAAGRAQIRAHLDALDRRATSAAPDGDELPE